MRARLTLLVMLLAMVLSVPAGAVGVDTDVLIDPAEEAQAQAIMTQLRCLVCQNQSIVDSDAPLAGDLRQIVRERVALGDDVDDVKDYMVARYGDWVLLNPPIKPATFILWGAPLAVLMLGIGIVTIMRRADRNNLDLSGVDAQKADQMLKDGLE